MKKILIAVAASLMISALSLHLSPISYAEAGSSRYQRKEIEVSVPDVVLINQNSERVRLRTLLASDKPVLLDFIYCTCTTICPVLSSGYVNLQNKLGSGSDRVQLVSVSIDPENDTPKAMKEYLKRYQAKPGWDFLTGSRKDIDKVMRAFDAYIPDKMSHSPLTFIRSGKNGRWVKLNGMTSTSELMGEVSRAENF
jgi:protein SCO1/2